MPQSTAERRLVLAPHMDDESLGCGGLLAKYPGQCTVVSVAGGSVERQREHAEAMRRLGVTQYSNLGLPDGYLGNDMANLVRLIDDVVDRFMPDEMYLPFPSLHQDHIAVYEAGMRNARLSMNPSHWFTPAVLVYDITAYDLSLYPTNLQWNVALRLTERHAERKQAACSAYSSQNPGGCHPINAVVESSSAVGASYRTGYAERYALVRMIL